MSAFPPSFPPPRFLSSVVLRWVWQHCRFWIVLEWAIRALLSVYPALTVLGIRALGSTPSTGASLVVGVSIIFGCAGALQQISYSLSRRVAVSIEASVAQAISSRLATASPLWLRDPTNAQVIRAVRQASVESQTSSLYQAVCNCVAACIVAFSLSLALWPLSPAAALCSVFAALPTIISYMWVGRKEAQVWPRATDHQRRAFYFEDQLSFPVSSSELALLKAGSLFAMHASTERGSWKALKVSMESWAIRTYIISGFLTSGIIGATLLLVAAPGSSFDIAAGIVGLLASISALSGVGYQIGELATTRPAVSRLMSFLSYPRETMPAVAPRLWNSLKITDLSVRYPDQEKLAVQHVSFTADRGQITAIVGANGSGKSTIINAIVGALDYDGEILLDSDPVAYFFPLGIQTQNFGMYEISVRDFLCLGSCFSDAEIFEALKKAQASGFVDALPHGLATQLGEQWGGVGLSGGQWQRLSLARLFLHDHPVWILDEPTSAVDALTEDQLFRALRVAKPNKIIIVVTHRASVLSMVDKIIVLESGKVAEQGSFEHLRSPGTCFSALFRSQITEI